LAVGDAAAERLRLPAVRGPEEPAGWLIPEAAAELGLRAGIPVGPGSGDNPMAAVGVGAAAGEIVISLGTSGVAYAVSDRPTADESGEVAGFADATGRFLPLACMLNCTRVLDAVAQMFGLTLPDALALAADAEPGAGGLLMIPYLAGERTPDLPSATGALFGLTAANATPHCFVRAAVDGVAAGLAYCIDALARAGATGERLVLVGGGARHVAWRQAVADASGMPVVVRGGDEHVARGAAIQAAAIVQGKTVRTVADAWRPAIVAECEPNHAARGAFQHERRREYIEALKRRNA
jgi:xylulokinase